MAPFLRDIGKWLDRLNGVSTWLPAAVGIVAFAAGWLLLGLMRAIPLGLLAFGLVAFIEGVRREARAALDARCQKADFSLLTELRKQFPGQLEHHSELLYGGLKFNTLRVAGIPRPFAVSTPFCPTCGDHIAERTRLRFMAFPQIVFSCDCGFALKSKKTTHELRKALEAKFRIAD